MGVYFFSLAKKIVGLVWFGFLSGGSFTKRPVGSLFHILMPAVSLEKVLINLTFTLYIRILYTEQGLITRVGHGPDKHSPESSF